MGLVQLMDKNDKKTAANDYAFSLVGAADEVSTGLINGSLDIAAVPANLGAVLYNKTAGKVQVLAINTLGVLYVLEQGDSIKSVTDLKGKTIYSTGKGTTPEYSLNYILSKNGLKEGDVTVEYRSEAAEIAALLEQGTAKIAVLPEPMVTSTMAKNTNLRVALNLSEEWDKVKVGDEMLVTGTFVVRKEFLDKNKAAVDAFLSEAKASIAAAQGDLQGTAALVAKYGILPSAAVAAKAIPNCNIIYLDGDAMKAALSGYLDVLFTANPQSVGGKLPDAGFYYKK